MKKLTLLLALFTVNIYFAQSPSFQAFVNKIKSSGKYYWGVASAQNMREADEEALAELVSKISVTVSSSFEHNISGKNENFDESVEKVLKTYTTASLRETNSKQDFYNGISYVLRYIEKEKVKEIFEERKKLCYDLYQNAIGFESSADYGNALKYYYFSLILMNSVPEQNIAVFGTNLKTEIPRRINNILRGVKFTIISIKKINDKEKIISFEVKFNNKPVNNLEYSFWDGNNFVDANVKDGISDISLIGSSISFDEIIINIKYDYYSHREEIKEVAQLWDLVKRPVFNNTFRLKIKDKNLFEESGVPEINNYDSSEVHEQKSSSVKSIEENLVENGKIKLTLNLKTKCPVLNKIFDNCLKLLELINRNDVNGLATFLDGDEFLKQKVLNIIKYNRLKLVKFNIKADLNKIAEGYEVRKVEVINSYLSLNKQSKEYLITDFDKNGNLYDINYGIMDNLYKEFVEQAKYGNDWGNRQIIIKFMEKYRTAYLSRDLKMLDKMFADEALIIVGRILKTKHRKSSDAVKYLQMNDSQPSYEQIKLTKRQYLNRQRRIFRSRQDIFLDFYKFKILRKNNSSGVYGITLRQSYESTGYSDEGYLFLLIDFNKKNPQIYVRSWQPQEWNKETLIDLSNFNIND